MRSSEETSLTPIEYSTAACIQNRPAQAVRKANAAACLSFQATWSSFDWKAMKICNLLSFSLLLRLDFDLNYEVIWW
jgi:hypothetical protein